MNTLTQRFNPLIAVVLAALLTAACAPALTRPDGASAVRSKLTRLQSDPQLATLAPVAIKDAELAVRAAEEPRADTDLARHLVFMADRKVDIAWARAQGRLAEDQRQMLSEQRERSRLDSRTREADQARSDATSARTDAEIARTDAEIARGDAEIARSEADRARAEAAAAGRATQQAQQQTGDLQRQMAELNAKTTDRGMVVTLGDVLFASGRAEIKGGAAGNLRKLAAFLKQYPERSVVIEGHTDSVGSDDFNLGLSQRRANSVMSYLVGQGVESSRLTAAGLGEAAPVSGNESSTGRQQNRRVEVIIENTSTSSR